MKYTILGVLLAALTVAGCGDSVQTPPPTPPVVTDIEIKPESDALFHEAARLYGTGHHTEALDRLHKALSVDPNNYKALSLKGVIVAFDISPDGGIPYIDEALRLAPHYVQAHYDMALAQKLGKHYETSISHFEKVIQADPKNTWSYYGIATNYADMHNKEKALFYLEIALRYGKDEVRQAAQSQDHFQWLRDDEDFQKLLASS